jgi:predicted dehydrogenase
MIKVAVIGVGSMGRNHARVYSEIPDAELVAVADTNLAVAQEASARIGGKVYTSYQEMLSAENLDAVSIAVPSALHAEAALAALDAGVHVLIEKPIASTIAEAEEIIRQSRKSNRQVMVGHIVRFNPAMQVLKHKLDHGDLGRIYQITCRRIGPFPARIRDVGVVIDLAPHDIDLMRYLLGADPIRIYAETQQRIHTEHEDLLLAFMKFPEGAAGSLEINWLTPNKVREVLVLGERGLFRIDDLTQDLYFYENAQANAITWSALQTLKGVSEGSMIRYPLQRFEPLKAELKAFLHAIESGTPVPVSGEDGLAALKIAAALVESGIQHRVIEFSS